MLIRFFSIKIFHTYLTCLIHTHSMKIVTYSKPIGMFINGYIDFIEDHIDTLYTNHVLNVEKNAIVNNSISCLNKSTILDNDVFKKRWNLDVLEKFEKLKNINMIDIHLGVLDTPIDSNHTSLNYREYTSSNNHSAGDHGTHCLGIILEKNTDTYSSIMGYPEYNFKVTIFPGLKLFGKTTIMDIIMQIDEAMKMNVTIMNHSWGTINQSYALHKSFQESSSMLHVVAAGNNRGDVEVVKMSPAIYSLTLSNVITVGSLDETLKRSSFSNYGKAVNIYAPGNNIISTCVNNRYCIMSGTSMATPHVTAFALYIKAANPHLTPKKLKEFIIENSTKLYNNI